MKISLYLLLYLCVIITIVFFTLLEEKVLCVIHLCKGPIYVGYLGIIQSFSYALKLVRYFFITRKFKNKFIFILAPFFSLIISLLLWITCPLFYLGINWSASLIYILLILSLSVFPVLIRGWRSNRKYTILARVRRVRQIISYEITLGFFILSIFCYRGRLNLLKIYFKENVNFLIFLPVVLIIFICILAETHRRPFDFTERASELVCGYHTEYGGLNFTLLFIREYIRILFRGLLISTIFFNFFLLFLGVLIRLIGFIFIWVRGTVIRFRYDLIIILNWKILLPIIINFYGYLWIINLNFY